MTLLSLDQQHQCTKKEMKALTRTSSLVSFLSTSRFPSSVYGAVLIVHFYLGNLDMV